MSTDIQKSIMEEQPKIWATTEEINKTQFDRELSQKFTQINNVLHILDLPDNQEEFFRKIFEKQDKKTLELLATKSKTEIFLFLHRFKKKELKIEQEDSNIKNDETTRIKTQEQEKQTLKNEQITQKLTKIKSAFTPSILETNPDIAKKLNSLDSTDNPKEKDKILQEILQILKNPRRLKAITDKLGGADKNNPNYLEFKNALIGVDNSFESYFNDLENLTSDKNLNTDEVISGIETDSWWVIDIDLKANPPVSKLSLIGSNYSFDEKIDESALADILWDNQNNFEAVQNGFAVLKGFAKPFSLLLTQIGEHWNKATFGENLKIAVANFSKNIFSDSIYLYENTELAINPNDQINEMDILDLADSTPEELKSKIKNIKTKLGNMTKQLQKVQVGILKKHEDEIKKLLTRESQEQEKQLEVLQFLRESGFETINQGLTNRIIEQIKWGWLKIPWLDLSPSNIELKNGHFGENLVFNNREAGLNIEAKRNLVKFMNKLISGDITKPLPVEDIANGVSIVDPFTLQNEFLKAWIFDGLGWKYEKVMGNLKSQ